MKSTIKKIFPAGYLMFVLLSTQSFYLIAQGPKIFDASFLQLEWELVKDVTAGDPHFNAVLILNNKGGVALPTSGWRLYFNLRYHGHQLKAVNKDFEIHHANGELFYITPLASFQGTLPGKSSRVEYSGDRRIANFQDVPSGFFLTEDKTQGKAIALANPFVKSRNNLPVADANVIYRTNESIRNIPEEKLPKIFPTTSSYKEKEGSFFLNDEISIISDSYFEKEADFLREELKNIFGRPITITKSNSKTIVFRKENLLAESYHLSITTEGITINAPDGAGIFYGIQSLQSLYPLTAWTSKPKEIRIACAEVNDQPRFPIRAFMLDVARNFQSKEQIIRILDVMSLYKLNVFHLHFSDDEGWRLAIRGLPELTEIGSSRGYPFEDDQRLQPSYGSGPNANPLQGTGTGFYSREDFIEILKYATTRHIAIIPEIESPGHARAAIKSMDVRYKKYMEAGNKAEAERYLLRDIQDQSVYMSNQYFDDNVMNVALPSTYVFVEKVVDEIRQMYKDADAPLTMIHMAGDEVPHGSWEKSPAVLRYMQQNTAMKSGDDLWRSHFVKIKALLKVRGLSLYGWEELVLGKQNADESRTVAYNEDFIKDKVLLDAWWNVGHEGLPYSMANMGYRVVLSCFDHFYFDLAYSPSFDEPGDAWVGYLDLKKTFSFSPFNYFRYTTTSMAGNPLPENYFQGKENLKENAKSNIMGLQAALWGENLSRPDLVEYMLLPRLLAVAERAWAKEANWELEKDDAKSKLLHEEAWSIFANTLGKKELPRLDYYHGGFGYRIPSPSAVQQQNGIMINHQLPGFEIRYTTDGTEPTTASERFENIIKTEGRIKVKAFNQRGRSSHVVEVEAKPN